VKIALTPQPTIRPYEREIKAEAVVAPTEIYTQLKNQAQRNSQRQQKVLTGPLSALNAENGFSFAQPVRVGPGVDLFPVINTLTNPEVNPLLAGDLISGVTAVAEAPSFKQGVWRASDLAEIVPGLPPLASAAVHVIGIVRWGSDSLELLKKADTKDKDKVRGGVMAGLAVAVLKLATDYPGLASAKPTVDRFAAAVEVGNRILLYRLAAPGKVRGAK
jgi:hypothetical protein